MTGRAVAGRAVAGRAVAGRAATGRPERGSAVPFAVACLGLVLLLGAALGVVGAIVVAHRVAQAAADLAALAGAAALADGSDGCAAAASVASANGAAVTSCHAAGDQVVLRLVVASPGWRGLAAEIGAEARAGPAGR